MTIPSWAQPVFQFESETAVPGEQVCIGVSVSQFTDILAMQMSIHWDPTVLQYQSVGGFNLPFMGGFSFGTIYADQGDLLLSWYDGAGNAQSVPDGTVIFEICFTVIGQPGDNTTLYIDGDPTPVEIVSSAGGGTVVGMSQIEGSVLIVPPMASAIDLVLSDAVATLGEQACVQLNANQFDEITALQFQITWDPGLLQFAGANSFFLPGLDPSDLDLSNLSSGVLMVAWNDPAGVTLDDGAPLLQLCFESVVNQGFVTDIDIDDGGVANNSSSGNANIGINTGSGSVTFAPPPAPDLLVGIGSEEVAQGLSFCIPVTVQQFISLTGGFLSLQWDPDVITYDTMHVLDLVNLQPANFQVNAITGQAVMVWDAGIPLGLTLADNSAIFEICFTASGVPGSSTLLDVSNIPLVTIFENAQQATVQVSASAGQIVILPAIPPISLEILDANASPGDVVCLSVIPGEATGLLTMSAGISWDPALLNFQEVQLTGWPDLEMVDFNVSGTSAGSLSVQWTSGMPMGMDVPAGTEWFALCFQVLAQDDAVIPVIVDESVWPSSAVTNTSFGNNIGVEGNGGSVTVVDGLYIADALVTHTNCYAPDGGAIDITVAGGTPPYDYQWSNAVQVEDPSGLTQGTYSVTVTDSSVPLKTVSAQYAITGDFNAPIAFVLPPNAITCWQTTALLDGSFSTGGSPIQYAWTTNDGNILAGQTAQQALVNAPGTYYFTVLNTLNGCTNGYTTQVDADTTPPETTLMALDSINCAHVTAHLSGNIDAGNAGYLFEWITPDGHFIEGTVGGMNPEVDVAAMYYLIGINSDNGCRDTASVAVIADFVPPVATAVVNGVLDCVTPSLTLDGNGSSQGAVFTSQWHTFEGHFLCCEDTYFAQVDAPGLYFLTITNTVNFCETTTPVWVEADAATPIALIQPADTISCTQPSLILDASSSTTGPDFSFQWTSSDGTILTGQNSSVSLIGSGGTYQLIVSYLSGQCQDTAWVTVVENMDHPAVAAGSDLSITCQVEVVTPSASGEGQPTWTSLEGWTLSGEHTFSPILNQPGTYVLEVAGSNGCMASDTLLVNIDTLPPLAEAGVDLILPCLESQMAIDATSSSSGTAYQYEWITANGTVLGGASGLQPVVTAGAYQLIVTDLVNGCRDTDQVVVDPFIFPPFAHAGADQVVCSGSVWLSANLPPGTLGIWSAPSGVILDDPAAAETLASGLLPGDNTLVWTLSTADCPAYSSDEVTISLSEGLRAFDDVFDISGGDSIGVFEVTGNDWLQHADAWEVSALTQPETGQLTYLGDGNFQYIAAAGIAGNVGFTYTLCNVACPESACDTGFVRIRILDPPLAADPDLVPNGITPNGDGLNEVLFIPELANTPDQYPDAELIVFNRWGDMVFRSQPYLNDWDGRSSDGSDLPQGTYYYILRLSIPRSEYRKGDITIVR